MSSYENAGLDADVIADAFALPEMAPSAVMGRAPGHHRMVRDRINSGSLAIHYALVGAVQACEPHAEPYKNLAALFYHEILRLLSAYDIRRVELAFGTVMSTFRDRRLPSYPYVDFLDTRDGIDLQSKNFKSKAVNGMARDWRILVIGLAGRLTGAFGPCVGLTPNDVGLAECALAMMRRGWCLSFPSLARIHIPNIERQWTLLDERLEELLSRLAHPRDRKDILTLIHRHVDGFIADRPTKLGLDGLVCGTGCKLANRMLAAQTLYEGAPVIGVRHGYGDGILDEPAFGPGDGSFVSHLLSYGSASEAAFAGGRHLFSVTPGRRVVASNADPVMELFDPRAAIRPLPANDGRLFYVPTSSSGMNTYGPYRSLPDDLYLDWQRRVMRLFPNALIKPHPDDVVYLADKVIGRERIVTGRLEDLIGQADGFVFDYVSTALNLACATDKPIVFLDLGVRNLSAQGKHALQQRCIYVDVADKDDNAIIEEVCSARNKPRLNVYTPQFSLDGTPRPRRMALIETVRHALVEYRRTR